jgi:hypothetical protein
MGMKFRFRSHDHIGAADAESDQAFLRECFIDNGDIDLLLDCNDHRRIILGRTGAGKTALLTHLSERTNRVITIKPESLALAYISNSTILQFVNELGVNLDTFFKLLWRHVFTVEVIKAHFHLDSAAAKEGFVEWLKNQFSDKRRQHEKALSYLEKWGSRFWEQTDYRIEELTTKLENELRTSISTVLPPTKIVLGGAQALSQEEKGKVVERAKYVVNQVQIQELTYVLELLDSILDDPQKRYYIVIDRLDENWIEEELRYLLIRALIETVRDFCRVRQAKIIVALRYDLLDRVLRLSRGAGFQEEKYESLYVDLSWNKEQLTKLLDKRIDKLVRQQYSSSPVTHADVLPKLVNKVPAIDYMLARTLMRPRDVIMFFNTCIKQAPGNAQITPQMLKEAEGEYSRQRLRSLADEWSADFPYLMSIFDVLKGRTAQFPIKSISDDDCVELAIRLMDQSIVDEELHGAINQVERNPASTDNLRRCVVALLYRVGVVGLKLERFESVEWSTSGRRSVSISEIAPGVRVSIHPCFWRSLGINPDDEQNECSQASASGVGMSIERN